MNVYACGTPVRLKILQAVARSLKAPCYPEPKPDYKGGDAVIWGLIRGAPALINKVKEAGNNYWHMDNGYLGRNHYYRITKNANQLVDIAERPDDRWKKLGKTLKPWKRDGGHILVALSTEHLYKFYGLDIEEYKKQTVEELKKHTDRKIVLRDKNAPVPIENDLQNAWALVTYTSAAALDALQMGVPVFVTGPAAARHCSKPLSEIERPWYGDREPLFRSLAYGQWTIEELEKGVWKSYGYSSVSTEENLLSSAHLATAS